MRRVIDWLFCLWLVLIMSIVWEPLTVRGRARRQAKVDALVAEMKTRYGL